MRINAIGSTDPQTANDLRQPLPAAPPPETAATATAPQSVLLGGKPQKPLDQVADDLKNIVLQAQDVADADPNGASNEMLTQLFRTLVDLLAEPPPQPMTKFDV